MGLQFEEVKRIKEEFQRLYVFIKPYSDYTGGCGISKVGICDKAADNSVSEDLCIIVMLREPLPPNLSLPTEYRNVKVFTKIIGKITMEGLGNLDNL